MDISSDKHVERLKKTANVMFLLFLVRDDGGEGEESLRKGRNLDPQ